MIGANSIRLACSSVKNIKSRYSEADVHDAKVRGIWLGQRSSKLYEQCDLGNLITQCNLICADIFEFIFLLISEENKISKSTF